VCLYREWQKEALAGLSGYLGLLQRQLDLLIFGSLDPSPQLEDFLRGPIPPHGVIVAEIEYVRTPPVLEFGEAFAVAGELIGVGSHGARVARRGRPEAMGNAAVHSRSSRFC